MAEEQTSTSAPKATTKANDGFSGPIPVPVGEEVPDHIHPVTLMAKGFAPDSKKQVAVSLAVLQFQHGDEKGKAIYDHVARVGGFFDPNSEPRGSNFTPDLQLEGMDPKVASQILDILKAA